MARKKKQGGITLADVAKGVFMLATAAKLKTRREVEAGLRETLPSAVVLGVETGTRSKGCKFKSFTIAYRDIQFTYESYQSGNFFFAGKSAMSNDDYCKQLFRHFSREIGEIGEKYGVRIDGGCGISICNDVAAMEDLDAGVDALGELYALLEDYIPRKKLTQEEVKAEVIALQDMGHKRLAIESGEDPVICCGSPFFCATIWSSGGTGTLPGPAGGCI